MMLLLNVVTNERLLLEYNISRFSVSSNTRLFFYPNGSYYNLNGVIYPDVSQTSTIKEKTLQMQALRRFYTALSINSSVLRGSLLLNFWRTGDSSKWSGQILSGQYRGFLLQLHCGLGGR